jgi:pimeloyl-ACP methyl ester carboxylesterase
MLVVTIFLGLYILICGIMFVLQEKLIFFPQQLDKNHVFTFEQSFDEINIKTKDQKNLHGLLFKTDSTKGLIFYLHGNAGSLDGWGGVAETYTNLKYDVFILDYRGYGKSEGFISSETQLFHDVQVAYNEMLKSYKEEEIIVLGYSLGTGPAAKLASTNQPKLLILQAPYFSIADVAKRSFPLIPTFLLKYKLETHQYIMQCNMPIILFHGEEDEVIYYGSSLKLKEFLKEGDTLITLTGQAHNNMTYNPDYIMAIQKILR